MDRAQKSEMVSTLNEVFSNTGVVVVAHYSGLTVAQMTALRGRMKDAGASLKVAKWYTKRHNINRHSQRHRRQQRAHGVAGIFISVRK